MLNEIYSQIESLNEEEILDMILSIESFTDALGLYELLLCRYWYFKDVSEELWDEYWNNEKMFQFQLDITFQQNLSSLHSIFQNAGNRDKVEFTYYKPTPDISINLKDYFTL